MTLKSQLIFLFIYLFLITLDCVLREEKREGIQYQIPIKGL